jgi:hypothetical protein
LLLLELLPFLACHWELHLKFHWCSQAWEISPSPIQSSWLSFPGILESDHGGLWVGLSDHISGLISLQCPLAHSV